MSGISGTAGGEGVGTIPYKRRAGLDYDNDGLPDIAEFVIGTREDLADSDQDNISDASEIEQGLNPLDGRSLPIGISATHQISGESKSVEVVGLPSGDGGQRAFVASGSHGLAVVDVSQNQRPLTLAELDLSGDATDVGVDTSLSLAAVASNSGGLHIVDVTVAASPTLVHTIAGNFSQVEVLDGVAFTSVGGELRSYDMLTGERLQSLSLSGGTITGVARESSTLYTMDSSNVLRAVSINGLAMTARGSLSIPQGGGKLSVGNGIAYVAAEDGFNGGFATANVSNPSSLSLISGRDANNIAGKSVVPNGSGLAIAVGNPGGAFGTNVLDIVDVRDPANTASFVTRITLPSAPQSVNLAGGLAFVANGSTGLQVVNYLPFDNLGIAPTVSVNTTGLDIDPVVAGIQVQEGSNIRLNATFNDDVQIRNVELLVDGQVVRNDVSFPFDLTTIAPLLADGASTATLQVRATDTGGNFAVSTPITLNLVPDTVAPTILSTNPPEGGIRGQNFRAITIDFSEPMSAATLISANFSLVGPGGVIVAPTNIQTRSGGQQVQLTFPQLAVGAWQFRMDAAAIQDRAGNVVGTTQAVRNFNIREATSVWINNSGGNWDDASNWDAGTVPTTTDDVLIPSSITGSITYRSQSGTTTIRSLDLAAPLSVTGGTLVVTQTLETSSNITLAGGTLKDAVVTASGGAKLLFTQQGGTLDGLTSNADLDLTAASVWATVVNGLTLNGTATIGGAGDFNRLEFAGSQTLGGTGQVVFASGGNGSPMLRVRDGGTTLTIGSSMTVRGGHASGSYVAVIGYNNQYGGNTNVSVINNGTISADVSGKVIRVGGASFTNNGTVEAKVGGEININSAFANVLGGALRTEISGTGASQFGRITATGAVTLAGTLDIRLVGGFIPQVGNTFQIMTFGSRTGTFDTVLGTDAGNGRTFGIQYNSTNVTLIVT
jgi:hypothetical protein